VNQTRGGAIAEAHQRNRRWAHEDPVQRDEAWFKREILPNLDGFSLKEIASVTGLSLAACSRIRAGAKVPHPRHWEALAALTHARKAGDQAGAARSLNSAAWPWQHRFQPAP
jgi:hypothetical protein